MRRLALLLPFALAACSDPPPPAVTQTPPAQPAPVAPAPPPPPPAVAPMTPPAAQANAASFEGYGATRFGMDEAAFRAALGGNMPELPKDESCVVFNPLDAAGPGFMFSDGKFVRVSFDTDGDIAPGGGKVGMTEAQIDALYPGRIEKQPHKYVEGQYLRIEDAAGGSGVLIFETSEGIVTSWRVGVPPQIDYIEGCS